MTNLEFIESLIQKVETSLVHINTWKDNKQELKVLKKDLNHLKQIKTILEAWEVVNPKISVEKGTFDYANINIKDWHHHLTKEQYETLKKALETKEND